MGAVGATSLMTAEEFVALPSHPRQRPWSLVGGEVVVNSALRIHDVAVTNVLVALEFWTRAASGRGRAGGAIDIAIDDQNVYEPDVQWYSTGRSPAIDAPAPYLMPDLVVEVRSPSTWRYDVGAKKDGYERRGLRELWLVDTEARSLLVYRRARAASDSFDIALELTATDAVTSPLLPGFVMAVDEVFAVD